MADFITEDVWGGISKEAHRSKGVSFVSVAYFGNGASKLLPLKRGSFLVVDASDAAVRAGQTKPQELLQMVKRGVNVFRHGSLHAKVFAFEKAGFVGSANVSRNSANVLQEAVVRVQGKCLNALRQFVSDIALEPLGPAELRRLQKLYRPPKFVAGRTSSTKRSASPRLRVVHTRGVDLSDALEAAFDAGEKEAKKNRTRKRGFEVHSFYWDVGGNFRRGQTIVDVFEDGRYKEISPPGTVIYTKRYAHGRERKLLVYYESKNRDWKRAGELDHATRKLLKRGGYKSASASEAILRALR